MRIQHNIMAMNAYRNYTNNVSAMKKNLEKLSSGYKINRAGDDAAGLAISEKMRAQITGLQTAQKNAKDGISLVQTAEGALTEVHDMLNRMVELATQSANGTYDNTTDRYQLQKEVDQLLDEINRIADSANFNGIKLLDGSMDGSGKEAVEAVTKDATGMLPDVGKILGKDTVLNSEAGAAADKTVMSVDLHNLEVTGLKGQEFKIKIGDLELTGTLAKDFSTTALTADDIAGALANGTTTNVSFKDADGNAYDKDAIKIGDAEFKATGKSGTRVSFEQTNADKVDFNPELKVSVTVGTEEATPVATATTTKGTPDIGGFNAGTKAAGTATQGATSDWSTGTTKVTAANITAIAAMNQLDVGGHKVDISGVAADLTADETTATEAMAAIKAAIKAAIPGLNETAALGTTTYNEIDVDSIEVVSDGTSGFKVTFQQTPQTYAANKTPATAASTVVDFSGKTGKDVIGGTVKIGDKTYEFVKTGGTKSDTSDVAVEVDENTTAVKIAEKLAAAATNTPPTDVATAVQGAGVNAARVTFTGANAGTSDDAKVAATISKAGGDPTLSGDYNVSTTNIAKKGDAAGERLASTWFNLDKAMAANGNEITIGKTTYKFTTDLADKTKLDANDDNKVYVGDLDLSTKEGLIEAADRLTKVANANTTYTVGHDGTRMTFTEKKGQTDFQANSKSTLNTLENIEKSFGFKTAAQAAVEADNSKGLVLQIGDTADSYNQLKVNIKDMHAASLGLEGLSIANQEDAAKSVDKIKAAINTVSDVRGTLGATQNRLDHTINNLGVMTENIQDAESTIRDVDIAEEMMAYTKNNILIQSAQAMLAQANQVPQGVLQLLG